MTSHILYYNVIINQVNKYMFVNYLVLLFLGIIKYTMLKCC